MNTSQVCSILPPPSGTSLNRHRWRCNNCAQEDLSCYRPDGMQQRASGYCCGSLPLAGAYCWAEGGAVWNLGMHRGVWCAHADHYGHSGGSSSASEWSPSGAWGGARARGGVTGRQASVLTAAEVTEALTYTKLLPGSTVVQVVSYLVTSWALVRLGGGNGGLRVPLGTHDAGAGGAYSR